MEVPYIHEFDDADEKFSETYTLVAVVEHLGDTPKSGHYYTFVRADEAGGTWILHNDEIFKIYTWEEMTTMSSDTRQPGGRPYMLYYKRRATGGALTS